jgi:hypothetical protein
MNRDSILKMQLETLALLDMQLSAATREQDVPRMELITARVGHIVASMDLDLLTRMIQNGELTLDDVG